MLKRVVVGGSRGAQACRKGGGEEGGVVVVAMQTNLTMTAEAAATGLF